MHSNEIVPMVDYKENDGKVNPIYIASCKWPIMYNVHCILCILCIYIAFYLFYITLAKDFPAILFEIALN